MALDKIIIGSRIREIREDIFQETRDKFAKRCNVPERYIGQIERGEFLISLSSLDKIASATGANVDYLLYGTGKHHKMKSKENLYQIIENSDKDELQMYYKCICTMRSYVNKKDRE